MKINAVIGAGFGDEGKGLTTDWLINNSSSNEILNIRFNGGAQAGHTVTLEDGKRHIFSSIGSGTLQNMGNKHINTYYTKEFIIEPYRVIKELMELSQLGIENVSIYVNKDCRITTIYDIILNRLREDSRELRHGSCGYGIFETIKRDREVSLRVEDLLIGREHLLNKLVEIEKYFISTIEQLGYTKEDIKDLDLDSEERFEEKLNLLMQLKSKIVIINNEKSFIKSFNTVVFEGAQGLMLDMDNEEYMPHLTPSHTGLDNIVASLKDIVSEDDEFNIIYVTRSYKTRHGNGRLDYEVTKTNLGELVDDKTNVPNSFQGEIRYAKLDLESLSEKINNDFKKASVLGCEVTKNLMITHLDQTDGLLKTNNGDISVLEFSSSYKFNKIYLSYGETAKDVKGWK